MFPARPSVMWNNILINSKLWKIYRFLVGYLFPTISSQMNGIIMTRFIPSEKLRLKILAMPSCLLSTGALMPIFGINDILKTKVTMKFRISR